LHEADDKKSTIIVSARGEDEQHSHRDVYARRRQGEAERFMARCPAASRLLPADRQPASLVETTAGSIARCSMSLSAA
jgi:hypothetical protein